MRSYEAARGYFSFLSFISCCAIVGGGVLGLTAAAAVMETSRFGSPGIVIFLSAIPGLTLAGVGFFGLVFVQTSRATVDSAEYSQQALAVSRNQLEVSKQLLKLAEQRDKAVGYAAATSADDLAPISYDTDSSPQSSEAIETFEVLGRQIEQTSDGFQIEGQTFPSLEDAKRHVRVLVTAPTQSQPVER